MLAYYKQSPRWNKINKLDGDIKNIAKSNDKFSDYMNRLKNVITNEQDSDEDYRTAPKLNKKELLEKLRIKERVANR